MKKSRRFLHLTGWNQVEQVSLWSLSHVYLNVLLKMADCDWSTVQSASSLGQDQTNPSSLTLTWTQNMLQTARVSTCFCVTPFTEIYLFGLYLISWFLSPNDWVIPLWITSHYRDRWRVGQHWETSTERSDGGISGFQPCCQSRYEQPLLGRACLKPNSTTSLKASGSPAGLHSVPRVTTNFPSAPSEPHHFSSNLFSLSLWPLQKLQWGKKIPVWRKKIPKTTVNWKRNTTIA